MVGQDNPLKIMDEPSLVKPDDSKQRDDSKHSKNGLADTADHLVSKIPTKL